MVFQTIVYLVVAFSCVSEGRYDRVRKLYVRVDANNLTSQEWNSLRRGFQVMMDRPLSDPTSYLYQAYIHSVPSDVDVSDQEIVDNGWQQCQHGSYFLLPWHRMFLYYFEQLLRNASGDPDLTLPYWNYSGKRNTGLPQPFYDPPNDSNVLYTPLRCPSVNNGKPLPTELTNIVQAMGSVQFMSRSSDPYRCLSFGGQAVSAPVHIGTRASSIELVPHNTVHNYVGGAQPAGLMADVTRSVLDPCFWIHHSQIDRTWSLWLDIKRGRANPTADTKWMGQTFYFINIWGQRVGRSINTVLDIEKSLGYRYDDTPDVKRQYVPSERPERKVKVHATVIAATQPLIPSGQPIVDESAFSPLLILGKKVKKVALKIIQGLGLHYWSYVSEQLSLSIEVRKSTPGAIFGVYINVPSKQSENPPPSHYLGPMSLFVSNKANGHQHHARAGNDSSFVCFDMTSVVQNLIAKNTLTSKVTISFQPLYCNEDNSDNSDNSDYSDYSDDLRGVHRKGNLTSNSNQVDINNMMELGSIKVLAFIAQ